MSKLPTLILLALTAIVSLSCQSTSTGLQQSMVLADETAASNTLRTIAVAQQAYTVSNNNEYGTFQQLSAAGYLDSRFNSEAPVLKDYVLTMEVGRASEGPYFNLHADPSDPATRIGKHFFVDASTVLRWNQTQPATSTDPVYRP